jgi:hypothetical protein
MSRLPRLPLLRRPGQRSAGRPRHPAVAEALAVPLGA